MFGLIGNILDAAVSVAVGITGTVIGLSVSAVALTLGITVAMVKAATDAGCTTYEEIRDYHNLD